MRTIIDRLKDHGYLRWTTAYAAGAFVVLQLMDALEGPIGLTPFVQRAVLVLLVFGLPKTWVIVWHHGPQGRQRVTAPEVGLLSGLAGAAVALVFLLPTATDPGTSSSDLDTKKLDPRRIAVLPFEHRSATGDDRYFTAAIHDELISQLSRIQELAVVSSTSSERYSGTALSIHEIGRALQAGTIIEGSVQRVGPRIRITARVIDAQLDESAWTGSFEEEFSVEQLFRIQGAVVRQVAAAVRVSLGSKVEFQLGLPPTQSTEAYELYRRARYIWLSSSDQSQYSLAIRLYRESLELDPDFALAYADLAGIYGDWAGSGETEDRVQSAQDAAYRALAIDSTLSEAHAALGYLSHRFEWDFETALAHLARAVSLSPSNAIALHDYGRLLLDAGEPGNAIGYLPRAAALDPETSFIKTSLGIALMAAGQVADALEALETSYTQSPNAYAQTQLAYAHLQAGRPGEAVRRARIALRIAGQDSVFVLSRAAELLARAGRMDDASSLLNRAKSHPQVHAQDPVGLAWAYVGLNETDSAAVWLERALASRNRELVDWRLRSEWAAPIADHPRYQETMRAVGFRSR